MNRTWAVALAALIVAGCSGASPGGSSSTPPPPSTDQRAAVEQAVRAYSDAFLGGRGSDAYAMLSRRCQAANSPVEYKHLVAGASALYGGETIKTLTVDSIDGNAATVTYLYGNRNLDQHRQRWRLEGGAWRWDNC